MSLEQATALPYATMRFVHLGWRVIRIEATGDPGAQPGDPNRYIGRAVADETRHSLFVAPNVGKEAIGVDLKSASGRALLHRMITKLNVDVFCCNTLPMRYEQLGIDYATLSALNPKLIWAGISALGPDYPKTAGYDPIVQAMSGFMDINGFPEGPPTLIGLPLTDLKSGDELYSSVLLALMEQAETGVGARIDISMLQVAMSWLVAVLPLVDLGADAAEITRTGNAHRRFVPTNVYPTKGNFLYIAIGSNAQWQKLVALTPFLSLDESRFANASGRYEGREELYRRIGEITKTLEESELKYLLSGAGLPHTAINTVSDAMAEPAVKDRLMRTFTLDGRPIRLTPAAVDRKGMAREYSFAPRYGEHTDAVLREIGMTADEIKQLREDRVVG